MKTLVLLVALAAAPSADQIHGMVKDEAGKAVASVSVKAKDASGKAVGSAKSDKQGVFALKALPVGTYTLELSAPAFETETQSGVAVTADAVIEVEVVLRARGKQKSLRPTQGGW